MEEYRGGLLLLGIRVEDIQSREPEVQKLVAKTEAYNRRILGHLAALARGESLPDLPPAYYTGELDSIPDSVDIHSPTI